MVDMILLQVQPLTQKRVFATMASMSKRAQLPRRIGTLHETSLHLGLKNWYTLPGDLTEQVVDGYVIDIVRNDKLIEIQTGNFASLKRKLGALLPNHKVHLVYPVAQEKWICRQSLSGQLLARRKSPRHGRIEDLCGELLYIAAQALHPNFSLEVAQVLAEDVWTDDGLGSWRRQGWSLSDRRLLTVISQTSFSCHQDYYRLLPEIAEPFCTQDLACKLKIPQAKAQKVSYCLRKMGLIQVVGKQGRALLYSRC